MYNNANSHWSFPLNWTSFTTISEQLRTIDFVELFVCTKKNNYLRCYMQTCVPHSICCIQQNKASYISQSVRTNLTSNVFAMCKQRHAILTKVLLNVPKHPCMVRLDFFHLCQVQSGSLKTMMVLVSPSLPVLGRLQAVCNHTTE